MPDLSSSFTSTTTTPLPPPITPSRALHALHNHDLMIDLNPLVVSHRPLSSSLPSDTKHASSGTVPSTYLITDKLPIPLWPTTVSYTASFEDTSSGLRTEVHAPMGLEISGEWEVYDGDATAEPPGGEGGGLMLRETTTVRCNLLLMPYVRATMGKGHEELHRRFVERLLKE